MGGRRFPEFAVTDSEVLVKIVKAAQSRKVKGSRGEWKQFLRSSRDYKAGISDPAKHPWTTLAAFVHTFTDDADIQMVKQIQASEVRRKTIEDYELEGTWRDSPEQELVWLTRHHQRFREYYTFPSSTKGWVLTDLEEVEEKAVQEERMLSMDCEMVMCDDGEKEIVRVCIVDREYKTILDMLVKPTKQVVDYLTQITGICEADLEGVECGPLEAQGAVLKLLTADTILVGHSLYNDLQALKIDHPRVIDTSFIFQFRKKPECYSAGLNNLCKAVLGYEFREDGKPHDCLLDATIPMRIVLHTLKHGIKGPLEIEEKMLDEGQLCKLYFHGIMPPVSVDDLRRMFPQELSCEFMAISWGKNGSGTTYAMFSSVDYANRAFEELRGFRGEDSFGRPQKTVSVSVRLKKGKTKKLPVKVRKMSSADGAKREEGGMEAESAAEPNGVAPEKKRKLLDGETAVVAQEATNPCCGHLEDVKSLREQLKQKMEEVLALQKIIVDLTKGQL